MGQATNDVTGLCLAKKLQMREISFFFDQAITNTLRDSPLFSPLDTHCPNPGFRGKGIKGNYNISFTSCLQGLRGKSNAITW